MGRVLSMWVVAALLLAAAGVADDEPVYTVASLDRALAVPAATALARRIEAATAEADSAVLLESLDGAARLPDPARTMLTFNALLGLSVVDALPAARAAVEAHAADGASLLRWHDEEGRRVSVRAYDTSAAARFTLRTWSRDAARERAREEIAGGTFLLEKSTHIDAADAVAYAEALQRAAVADLVRARPAVAAALDRGEPVEPIVLVLIERLHDAELAALLLVRGQSGFVVRYLGAITNALAPDEAFRLLADASARPDIASAVVVRIGAIADRVPAARVWLYARLGHPTLGASAAAALGRGADAEVIAELAQILRHDDAPLAQLRAALALKLADTLQAKAALAAFAEEPGVPDALRRVVVQWLR